MSKQQEDVLLMVKHVRYKKVDGTLYVNSGRVAWRNQTSDSFKISAPFEDIRVQRISPDQKEKVQLQLLMHNSDSFTFQFSDPNGRAKQLEMRNSVKELLQSLLPKFMDKAQSELKEKFRLLESNPEILSLYKELVVTGILTSEEFWARPEFTSTTTTNSSAVVQKSDSRASTAHGSQSSGGKALAQNSSSQSSGQPTGQIARSFQLFDKPLSVGVPSYLLSDIKPEADGMNGIKYNLTHDTIDAIFRAYPTVRQRHRDLVPDKLSEADFWIKFFQSHYFHRDRVQLPKEDIFNECAIMDERYLQNELRRSRLSRISAHLDLDNLSDHDLGNGYGSELSTHLSTSASSNSTSTVTKSKSSASSLSTTHLSANQQLLRRFNNHSILVLKSLGTSDIASGLSSTTLIHNQSSSETHETNPSSFREAMYTPELVIDPQPPHISLDLNNVTDYFSGPTWKDQTSTFVQSGSAKLNSEQLERALKRCKTSMQSAFKVNRKPTASLLTTLDAQIALANVSPGGCLVGGKVCDPSKSDSVGGLNRPGSDLARLRSTGTTVSAPTSTSTTSSDQNSDLDRNLISLNSDQTRELSLLYASAAELLRHFWACFPVTNTQLSDKLERIAGSLDRFRVTKLTHFVSSINQTLVDRTTGPNGDNPPMIVNRSTLESFPYRSRHTGHLECMLDTAQQKFSEWKRRRKN